jgi:hypothetical protein
MSNLWKQAAPSKPPKKNPPQIFTVGVTAVVVNSGPFLKKFQSKDFINIYKKILFPVKKKTA